MSFDIANLMDSINRLQDLHALHEASGSCLECHNPWPCDTDSYLKKATNALRNQGDRRRLNPALELGKVLAAVESRFGIEGPSSESVISQLHHLVLEHGIEVTGRVGWISEYQVGVKVGGDTYRRLWQLNLASDLSIKIFAPTGDLTSQGFLSQVLAESFSPRDADQLVAWWDDNDESSHRIITLYFDDSNSITETILMLVEATTRFNNNRHAKQL